MKRECSRGTFASSSIRVMLARLPGCTSWPHTSSVLLGGKSATRFGQGKLVESTSFPSARLLGLRFAATIHQRPSKTVPSRFVAVSRRCQDVARQDFTSQRLRCCDVIATMKRWFLQKKDNHQNSPAKSTSGTQTAAEKRPPGPSRAHRTFQFISSFCHWA